MTERDPDLTCRRAFDADLLAVVRGQGDSAFAAHYPSCCECAAEVAVWRELDGMLRAGTPTNGDHPPAADLLAYVDAPGTLPPATRSEIEGHVAACRPCADEVRVLGSIDLARLTAAAVERPRRGPGWLGRVVWHPAFAYALVAVLLVPLLRDRFTLHSSEQVVRRERTVEPAAAPASQPPAPPAAEPRPASEPPAQLAARPRAALEEQRPREADARRLQRSNDVAGRARDVPGMAMAQAPAFEPLADRADGGRASGTVAASVWDVKAGAHPAIPAMDAERGLRLRVTPPAELANAIVDVRVQGRAHARELTQRVAVSANAIEVQIPPHWLAPGDYVVTLTPVVATSDSAAMERAREKATIALGFSVRAPQATDLPR